MPGDSTASGCPSGGWLGEKPRSRLPGPERKWLFLQGRQQLSRGQRCVQGHEGVRGSRRGKSHVLLSDATLFASAVYVTRFFLIQVQLTQDAY